MYRVLDKTMMMIVVSVLTKLTRCTCIHDNMVILSSYPINLVTHNYLHFFCENLHFTEFIAAINFIVSPNRFRDSFRRQFEKFSAIKR